MSKTPPRDLPIPAELEKHIQEHAPEFLARAVESAAKRGFAVEYKGIPAQMAPDCYDCVYCHRLRYLKGEWHCRTFKPHEITGPCACFAHRCERPSCLDCQNWHPDDPRCMHPRSQWAGLTTSPNNYCRFFERRPPEK